MRKIVILLCIVLTFSGIGLHYWDTIEGRVGFSLLSALHILIGIFFIVIFPMYSWDHVKTNQKRLNKITWVSSSGMIQLTGGSGLILTGIILLLYSGKKMILPTELHFWMTFLLAGSLLVHYFIKK